MAMGNFCHIQNIECPYAMSDGQCRDDICGDFGICEMLGDDMPPKDMSPEHRRRWVMEEKARADGRLKVLPVAPGQTVWVVNVERQGDGTPVLEATVSMVGCSKDSFTIVLSFPELPISWVSSTELGETVFVTKEGAKTAAVEWWGFQEEELNKEVK